MNEFQLIREFFSRQSVDRPDVLIGIGDDAAVLSIPPDRQLVTTTDMLVAGVHFLASADAQDIGHKSLAVNLSDLAAMGAEPAWFTLNVSLPQADTAWLREFCQGLFALAAEHGIQLVGGDTVRGPLAIGIQAHGLVEAGQALLRRGACDGDHIYVSGMVGDAGLALREQLGELVLDKLEAASVRPRLHRPIARVALGRRLRGLATSAIDISDGLVADLGHILEASAVGARIYAERLPVSPFYKARLAQLGYAVALTNGDDYELCFTAREEHADRLAAIARELDVTLTPIGVVEPQSGLRVLDENGRPYPLDKAGHDHFSQ